MGVKSFSCHPEAGPKDFVFVIARLKGTYVNLALRIVWSAALLIIVATVAWFILSPATNFLADFGNETQIGMLFVFFVMPSILFLLVSSGQLMKLWFQTALNQQIAWTIASALYATGLIAAMYFTFIA